MKKMKFLLAATIILFCSSVIAQENVTRYPNTGSTLPIAAAVEVGELLFHSGVVPSSANSDAERGTAAYWGDTEAQAETVFAKLKASLQGMGMDMDDVVKLNVYLVPDPDKGNVMDFGGFMKAYTRYFGEASNGQLPARAVVAVAGLVAPGMMVEIDLVAVRQSE